MKTFLIVVAGVVAGALILVALGWFWLKRKLKGFGAAFEALGSIASSIPSFRITLQAMEAAQSSSDGGTLRSMTRNFEERGYGRVGDFEIREFPGVSMRALRHAERETFAVITDHPEVGLYAELFREFTDGSLTVSTCPETGLDRPPSSPLVCLAIAASDPALCEQLESQMLARSEGRQALSSARDFTAVFESAYAAQMDWRIARGGVTAEEVRAAAVAGGQDAPDADAVEIMQEAWRMNIEGFVDEKAREAFLELDSMSPAEWESRRDRIWIVHEHADADGHIGSLASLVAQALLDGAGDEEGAEEDRAHDDAVSKLEPLFEGSIRAGFAQAQSLLPADRRYELLASLESPWPADVYLEPVDPDEA